MFLLIAILVRLAAGLCLGGRPDHLVRLHLRWPVLIFAALVIQVARLCSRRSGAFAVNLPERPRKLLR
jgi:hypothetical protein